MVKGVTDSVRISQDYTQQGITPTDESKTETPMTMDELDSVLGELGLPTFGPGDEAKVRRGSGEDTPRQDGVARNRGESVKNFFKSVGSGIKSFFSAIGGAVSKAFDAVKDAAMAKFDPQTRLTNERKHDVLLDICKKLTNDFEADYQTYLTTSPDEQKMTRTEFVAARMPAPEDGIDTGSMTYVGKTIGPVREAMTDPLDEAKTEMRDVIMDRLEEFPTLDIATDGLFSDEMKKLDANPNELLRGNTAYTKMDKFMAVSSIPFNKVGERMLDEAKEMMGNDGHLGIVDGHELGAKDMSPEQATVMHRVADGILEKMLTIDPDDEKSLFNSIPQEYRDHLADKADQILNRPGNATLQERKDGIRMMYVNSIFLRGVNGDFSKSVAEGLEGGDRVLVGRCMNLFQALLNGAENAFYNTSNEASGNCMRLISANHAPRLDAFLTAIGMPVIDVE